MENYNFNKLSNTNTKELKISKVGTNTSISLESDEETTSISFTLNRIFTQCVKIIISMIFIVISIGYFSLILQEFIVSNKSKNYSENPKKRILYFILYLTICFLMIIFQVINYLTDKKQYFRLMAFTSASIIILCILFICFYIYANKAKNFNKNFFTFTLVYSIMILISNIITLIILYRINKINLSKKQNIEEIINFTEIGNNQNSYKNKEDNIGIMVSDSNQSVKKNLPDFIEKDNNKINNDKNTVALVEEEVKNN